MKLFFKQSKNFLSKKNIDFINNIIISNDFPFYFNKNTLTNEKDAFFTHQVLKRIEDSPQYNVINSQFFNETIDILNNFSKSISQKIQFYTRISFNLTFNNGYEKSGIHTDHNFQHKLIIIYLNDSDKKSKTCILNSKNKVIKEVVPEKFKGFCFDGSPHFHYFPKSKHRLILMATFI